jgi:multiple sugar transport system substrate-binding protein
MSRKNTLSRRDFLRVAGVAGAAAVTGLPSIQQAMAAGPRQAAKTVNVLTVGDPWDLALRTVAKQFTDKTGITTKIESIGYEQLHNRLINAFITKTSDADVIAVDQMWISQYADNGWIDSLDQYIKADSDTHMDDFLPEVLYSLNTWRNHVWTLPVGAYAQGIMYRTDLFKQAGLDPLPSKVADAKDWTWSKYFDIVKKLNGMQMGDKKFFGTTLIGAQPVPVVHMFTQLSASYGTRWFKQFPEAPWDFTPTIKGPENLAALTDWKKLYDMAPPECINYVWFDAGTRFSQGDIALFFHWTPYFYLVNNNGYLTGTPSVVVDKFATAVLPTKDAGGKQVVSLGGWSLGMPSTAANKDSAWQFIKWATSADAQKAMGLVKDKGYQFADFSRMTNYKDPDLRKVYPFLDTQLESMKLGNGKIARPPAPVYTTLEGVYGLQINEVMSGSTTPQAALDMTNTLFANILSGNQMMPVEGKYPGQSFDDTLDNAKKLIQSLMGK